MDERRGREWVRAALLVGLLYFLIGRLFALPTDHALAWRRAAWLVSAVAYAAHIAYEHFKLRNSPRSLALHAAAAVAIGATAIALAGMIHSMSVTASIRPAWLFALVGFPAITAVLAFLVALVIGTVLARRTQLGQA